MVEIEINGKKFNIRELSYLEALDLERDNPKEAAKQTLRLCAGLTDDDLANLSIREGMQLTKEINTINGVEDFQKAGE